MAIAFVSGGTQQGTATNGGDVTLTPPTLAQGDVTYVFAGTVTGATMVTSGYSQVGSDVTSGTHVARLFRKIQGPTPDTSIVIGGTGNAAHTTAAMSIIFRGADQTTPEGAIATATGSSTNPDAPAVVTTRSNSVVAIFATSQVHDTAITAPTGYSNVITGSNTDTNPTSISRGWIAVPVSGTTENAPSWTNWATGAWCAISLEVLEDQGVGVSATTETLELTELAASVVVNLGVSATVDTLELTEHPASVVVDLGVSASVETLELTEHAATVTVGSDVSVTASVESLVLVEFSQSVAVSGGVVESTPGEITATRKLYSRSVRTQSATSRPRHSASRRANAYLSQNRNRAH